MPRNTHRVLLALILVAAALAPAVVAAQTSSGQVVGWPRLSVTTTTPEFEPGTESRLELSILNDPRLDSGGPTQYEQRVTTARGVTLEIRDGDVPFDVESDAVAVGDVAQGVTPVSPVTITVPEGTPAETYTLPVRVSYTSTRLVEYGSYETEYADYERSFTAHVRVRIRSQARFEVVSTSSSTQVGDTGTVTVGIENVGSERAENARVTLASATGDVRVGTAGGNLSSVHVGAWERGETATANFTVAIDEDAAQQSYALTARIRYDDVDGIARTSRDLSVGIRPLPEQTFAVRNFRSDLRVARNGTVSGTVVNTGETRARNPVVVFAAESGDLRPRPTSVALPDLTPGDAANFTFDVTVPAQATANTRQVSLTVRYRNQRGDVRESDPIERSVTVEPERDWFTLTPEATSFDVDTENRMTVHIENAESIPLRNVRATMSSGPPLESESSSAYVGELAPGESATLAFEVTVSDEAVATTTPVTIAITAERPDGDTVHAGPYTVPVTVREPTGATDVEMLVFGVVAVLVLFAGGWWWLQR